MDTNIVIVLVASVIAIIAAVLITAKVTTNRLKKNAEGTIGNAEEKAREIIDEALKTAENKKRESLLEVKEELSCRNCRQNIYRNWKEFQD